MCVRWELLTSYIFGILQSLLYTSRITELNLNTAMYKSCKKTSTQYKSCIDIMTFKLATEDVIQKNFEIL